MIRKILTKHWAVFLVLAALLINFRFFVTSGVSCKGDCIYFYPENLTKFFGWPLYWNTSPLGSGLGYSTIPFLSFMLPQPLGFIYWLTKFDFSVLEKLVWFSPSVILAVLGMYLLGRRLFGSKEALASAILFYLLNTYFILLVDGGQVGIMMAYSLLPLSLYLYFMAVENNTFKSGLIFGLVVSLSSIFDIRGTFFILLLSVFCGFTVANSPARMKFRPLFIAIITAGLLNIYWIAPLLLFGSANNINQNYFQASQAEFLSWANILNGITIFQPHWYNNEFGKTNSVNWAFNAVPLLIYLPAVFRKRNKTQLLFAFISLIFIFLVKGVNEPFGAVYQWLFNNIPGFAMFRDSTKFYIPLCLCYAVLIGYFFEELKGNRPKKLFFGFFLIFILFTTQPVWFGKMMGTFVPGSIQDYHNVGNAVVSDARFSRSIWYPNRREYTFSDGQHPAIDASYDFNNLRLTDAFISGTYDMFSYLGHPFSRQIFDVLGIKHVFVSDRIKKTPLSESQIKDRDRIRQALSQTDWLNKAGVYADIEHYTTESSVNHFFIADKLLWVVGSDDLYAKLDSFPNFKLRNTGIVFLDAVDNARLLPEQRSNIDYLVFNNKNKDDFTFDLAEKNSLIFPAKQIEGKELPDKSWISKSSLDFISWRDVMAQKGFDCLEYDYGGGFVFADDTSQNLSFFSDFSGRSDKYQLWLKYFASDIGGDFKLSVNGSDYIVNSKKLNNRFIWVKIGDVNAVGRLIFRFENINGFNAVNAAALLTDAQYDDLSEKAEAIIKRHANIFFYSKREIEENNSFVLLKKIEKAEILIKTTRGGYISGMQIDGKDYGKDGHFLGIGWQSLGLVDLDKGLHGVHLPQGVEELVVFEYREKSLLEIIGNNGKKDTLINYDSKNLAKYEIKASTAGPYVLIFSESYNPLWRLIFTGGAVAPIPAYGLLNAFRILDSDTNLNGVMEYYPQKYSEIFTSISLIFLTAILLYICFKRI